MLFRAFCLLERRNIEKRVDEEGWICLSEQAERGQSLSLNEEGPGEQDGESYDEEGIMEDTGNNRTFLS